ncbi:MAG TPA: Crp/Fnr family transcriptional regulator, partial [Phaeodactylibacter sp.]|nr:Crp/Fnr family transcriptional regulator [Phaeodactylibacter sp.]
QLSLIEEISAHAQYYTFPKGVEILKSGDYIKVIPLVIKGTLKVTGTDTSTGREVFLYYISKGQSCAMTLTSFLRMEKSKVKAITMEPTELLALPVEKVYTIHQKYPGWQHFLIDTFSQRFDELIHLFESSAFQHMDYKLVNHLANRSKLLNTTRLEISHQEIASDLASSREVISRLLKQLEKNGKVRLKRGIIELNPSFFTKNTTQSD